MDGIKTANGREAAATLTFSNGGEGAKKNNKVRVEDEEGFRVSSFYFYFSFFYKLCGIFSPFFLS